MLDEDNHDGRASTSATSRTKRPRMVFWHPRGWTLYRLLEEAARAHVLAGGYREVRTPQLLRRPVWEPSGHWGKFHDAMFACGEGADEAALKPVSCPGHIQLVERARAVVARPPDPDRASSGSSIATRRAARCTA